MSSMTRRILARMIDHTILKPEATEIEVRKVVEEAIKWGFASVCINGRWVCLVSSLLTDARHAHRFGEANFPVTCAVIGFPFGADTSSVKTFAAESCVREGAGEIDMVVCLPDLLAEHQNVVKDILGVVRAAKAVNISTVIKVILETSVLTESQIRFGCEAAKSAGADFVKTSTGFHSKGGATEQAVRWLKMYGGGFGLKVKAAGGIRDLVTAKKMIAAGADRLGCSASVAIVSELPE